MNIMHNEYHVIQGFNKIKIYIFKFSCKEDLCSILVYTIIAKR